ncbi:MAG: efflux RND transporter periplasmic adaptor subunit [Usitatibacter sp.]
MKRQDSLESLCALVFAICVLLALLLLTGCEHNVATTPEPHPEVKGQSVVFASSAPAVARLAVERVAAPVERELALPGRLTWNEDRTVRVFAPFAGRVARIAANVGERVSPGQALAEITSPDFGQAQSDARKAQADLDYSGKSLERTRELQAHGVASAKDLQLAEADYAKARAEADRALGRISAYGHAVGSELRFTLKAPVGGIVVERNLNPGQEVRPDQPGAPLFVVTDPTRLWVSLDASESDLRFLKPGLRLVISSNQFPEDEFSGELRQLADFVDPASRTVKLRGDVPNPNHTLKAEMFVTARLRLPKDELPTVDPKAVYLSGVRRYVFVRTGGSTYTRRVVRVGPVVDGRMPVLSGLKEGEEVVVAGNLFLEQILASARAEPAEESVAKAP